MTGAVAIEGGLRRVLGRHPEVRFALLFGSVVTRGADAAHDVDVGVAFRASPSLMELGRLEGELERELGRTVDLVDLDEATTLLRWEVTRTGQVVCDSDPVGRLEFQARVPLEFFDLQPHLERQARGLGRALGVRP
ncbi:MAG: nucleotidyltransferase domain-containing protein [Deltaproteobacteria bacterium]|nr:nucleotidyltransferase domain-containing protein [Deltaproteobacteria bacterium]